MAAVFQMRLTIEIPDDEVIRLVDPIVKAIHSQPSTRLETEVRLLRVPEVAKALGVSRATVYSMCQSGDLAAVRIGRRVDVTAEALRDYLSSQAGRPGAVSWPAPATIVTFI